MTAPDGTDIEVQIDAPLPGTVIDAPPCSPEIDVLGVASTIGLPPQLDVFFIIDRSGSTAGGILDDEVAAVRSVVRAVDPSHVRISIISFGSLARLDIRLTSDLAQVELALDAILADGSSGGGTEFVPPLVMLLDEVENFGDPSRVPFTLFLSDGLNSDPLADVQAQATLLAAEGVVIDTFGIGVDPLSLSEISRITGGEHSAPLDSKDILIVLPQVVAVGIDHIEVSNLTTAESVTVLPNLDGTFSTSLTAALGFNDIGVVAVAEDTDQTELACGTDLTVNCTTGPTFSSLPADETLHCPATPTPPVLTALDVCDDPLAVDFTESTTKGRCVDEYTVDRHWSATDDCGGTTTHDQRVQVVDVTAPVFAGVPADTAAECDAVPAPASPTAADGCDPNPVLSLTETRTDGRCADAYQLDRTWSATDRCSNVGTARQLIDVDDTTAPELRAQLVPATPLPPSSPSSPISAAAARSVCSPRSAREFIVECDATDNCDPAPEIEPTVVVSGHDVPSTGTCVPRSETIPVVCGERIEIRLLPPACPAKPQSPGSATSVRSDGVRVFIGESVVLEVESSDRCGNVSRASHDPTATPSPPCDDVLEDGTCCPLIGQPPGKACKLDRCDSAVPSRAPGLTPGLSRGARGRDAHHPAHGRRR